MKRPRGWSVAGAEAGTEGLAGAGADRARDWKAAGKMRRVPVVAVGVGGPDLCWLPNTTTCESNRKAAQLQLYRPWVCC